jgi:vacuolar-type H+-ATPase subunit H
LGKAEVLQQIKDVEEQVRRMTKEADEKRKQLQADGKRAALQKIDAADAALRKELDSKLADARAQTEKRKKVLLGEGAGKAAALTSSARKRMGDAKEYVLREFERAVDA